MINKRFGYWNVGYRYLVICAVLISSSFVSATTLLDYDFNVGSGAVVTDLSGNGNDGTLEGFANTSDAIGVFDTTEGWVAGGGLCFVNNGVRNFVETPLNLDALPGDFTLEFESNFGGTTNWAPVIASNAGSCCAQSLFFGVHSNQSGIEIRLQDAGGPIGLHPWANMPDETVFHIAMVFDGATNNVDLYIDGVLIDSGSKAANMAGSTSQFRIGNVGWSGSEEWNGIIYGIAISDEKLGPDTFVIPNRAMGRATNPTPSNESTDVPRDVTLSWMPNEWAETHRVFLSSAWEDANDASLTDPMNTLIAEAVDTNTLDIGRLEFGKTYYWRVDEVNNPATPGVFKGNVWSFTTELLAYPVTPETATASSTFNAVMTPDKTIDGSGLDAADLHGVVAGDMWLTANGDMDPWIQYEFSRPQKLHEMWVWNSNQSIEALIGFGIKDVTIELSTDGTNWSTLADVPPLAQAIGGVGYAHNTVVDFKGQAAKFVRISVDSGWGMLPQYGLSEIRFFAIPVYASQPQPVVGASDQPAELTLAWQAGRDAATHEVYVGMDPNDLTLVNSTPDSSSAVSLDLNQTHYWRIDEMNELEESALWPGEVWNFSTALYTVVDDMESYKDAEFFEIWATWLDGYNDSVNGALVGNGSAPETDITYDGGQSMPLIYGDGGASTSETTRSFDQVMDWSANGIKTLSLVFYGDPGNSAGQLYVGINGNRVADYPGTPEDLQQPQWHKWQIDLVALGITTVNSMTIGIAGGDGKLFIDAIRLYPSEAELTTPMVPDDGDLVAYYPLNNNTLDASGNGRDGTAVGNPLSVPGPSGMGSGLRFDGTGDQYVELGTWDPADTGQLTVSLWTQWFGISGQWQGLIGKRDGWSSSNMMWQIEAHIDTGVMRFGREGIGQVDSGLSLIEQGEWEPWVVTFDGTTAIIYRNGLAVTEGPFSLGTKTDASLQFGAGEQGGNNPYNGSLSEVRLYNRALSAAEVAGLVNRTAPFFE